MTSYAELMLAPPPADAAHPAFSKLSCKPSTCRRSEAILATRRRRSPADPETWAAHHAVIEGETLGKPEVETDRARFLGRGRDILAPIAMMDGRHLSNTVGTVLDAVFALRYRVRIPAGATVRIAFWTAVADSRESVLDLVDKHHEPNAFVRAATLAWTQAQIQLRHLAIDAAEATFISASRRLCALCRRVDAAVLRCHTPRQRRPGGVVGARDFRGSADRTSANRRRRRHCDRAPIAACSRILADEAAPVDLVILNERTSFLSQELQFALETQLRMSQSQPPIAADHTHGSVFLLRTDLISEEACARLSSVARVVLAGPRGNLADQLDRLRAPAAPATRRQARNAQFEVETTASKPPDLEFFNGLGGFSAGGREYVTLLGPGQTTPAPWINVIANPGFGFQVAAEGGGFTWALNSRENQLTPWSNDPVSDRPGEVLYVRDEESRELWGPTASPIREHGARYSARHGQGYSRFEHASHGIELDLLVYVPMDDPIKISRLKIRNTSPRTRRLSVTAYVEWVLGASRAATAPFIVTTIDSVTGAMLAHNPWSTVFGVQLSGPARQYRRRKSVEIGGA